jgi:hypothetical protein
MAIKRSGYKMSGSIQDIKGILYLNETDCQLLLLALNALVIASPEFEQQSERIASEIRKFK